MAWKGEPWDAICSKSSKMRGEVGLFGGKFKTDFVTLLSVFSNVDFFGGHSKANEWFETFLVTPLPLSPLSTRLHHPPGRAFVATALELHLGRAVEAMLREGTARDLQNGQRVP